MADHLFSSIRRCDLIKCCRETRLCYSAPKPRAEVGMVKKSRPITEEDFSGSNRNLACQYRIRGTLILKPCLPGKRVSKFRLLVAMWPSDNPRLIHLHPGAEESQCLSSGSAAAGHPAAKATAFASVAGSHESAKHMQPRTKQHIYIQGILMIRCCSAIM